MKGWTDKQAFDWSGVTTGAPPPAPDGLYLVRFTASEAEASASKKTPMVKLTLEIGEDEAGNEPKGYSKRLFDNLVFTQAAAWKIKAVAEAAGVPLPLDNSTESAIEFGNSLLEASKDGIYVRVKQETYTAKSGEERVRANVARYLTPDEVKQAKSASSNGMSASSETLRRPRRGAEAAVS